jgi:hypothetical protein
MVEGLFNTLPYVQRSALVGVRRAGVTYPVICLEFQPGHFPKAYLDTDEFRKSLDDLKRRHPLAQEPTAILRHPGFPVDIRHNAKIFREKLAIWADQTLGPKWTPGATR